MMMKLGLAATAGMLAASAVTAAHAGCGDDSWRTAKVADAAASQAGAYTPLGAATASGIVGMWSVTFYDAAGKVADFGYQQWHSDGTEILNSGGRSPASENFCMGVWAALHDNDYALNHWALGYDPASGALVARVNIKADVHVGPGGNVFSGTYTQDVFDPNGKLLVHFGGKYTGQRITVN